MRTPTSTFLTALLAVAAAAAIGIALADQTARLPARTTPAQATPQSPAGMQAGQPAEHQAEA